MRSGARLVSLRRRSSKGAKRERTVVQQGGFLFCLLFLLEMAGGGRGVCLSTMLALNWLRSRWVSIAGGSNSVMDLQYRGVTLG